MKYVQLLFVISVLSLSITSCGDGEKKKLGDEKTTTTPDSDKANKATRPSEQVKYVSIIDELRVRTEPNTKAEEVGELKFNQRALYMNEESDFKEKITLRGESKTDSWKKVKYSNSGATVVGWVFGGGLINEKELYSKEGDTFTRTVINATGKEVNMLLGLGLEKENYYNGSISYRSNESKQLIKHGQFNLTGKPITPIKGFQPICEVSGTYDNGTGTGTFKKSNSGSENNYTTTLTFKKGKCVLAEVNGNSEGEDYSHKEKNPSSSTFSFVENKTWKVIAYK